MLQRTILLASKDEDLVKSLSGPLQRHGYLIEVCSDGETALEQIRQIQPQAVVADLGLPLIDGIELCWMVREQLKPSWIPFLILSSLDDEEIRLNSFRSGVDAFLVRPFTLREFFVLLDGLILRSQQVQQYEANKAVAWYGELSEFHLPELIQWLHQNKKTGRLWLTHLYQRGSIYFLDGNIHSTHFGELEGEEAVFRMFRWQRGRFEFEVGEFPLVQNVSKSTVEILLECSKRLDEIKSHLSLSVTE